MTPPCCPPGSLPYLSASPGLGSPSSAPATSSLPPLPIYAAANAPSPATRIVLVFTDVFGLDSGNHRTFADELQAGLPPGVAVLVPDVFYGEPILRPWGEAFLPEKVGAALGFLGMLWRLRFQHKPDGIVGGTVLGQVGG